MSSKALLFSLFLLLGSCSQEAGPKQQIAYGKVAINSKDSPVVARVGKVELREFDVVRAMERDPGASPARFATPEARQELIEGLVRFELLAQAAERAGFTKDPDAIHALQQIAVTKLVNERLGAAGSPESISKEDVEREYLARQAQDYTLPEAAQVRHLRVSDAKLAERLAKQAKALPATDDAGFVQLVARHTEDATTRNSGGDLGFLDMNSKEPRPLLEAALALRALGDVAGPIEVNGACLRLTRRRAAAVSPLSSVEQPIRQRLYRERRTKALDDYIARLRRETPVEIAKNPKN